MLSAYVRRWRAFAVLVLSLSVAGTWPAQPALAALDSTGGGPPVVGPPGGWASPADVPLGVLLTHDDLEASFGGQLPEARGRWIEQSFYSPALARETAYLVWLPPGYFADERMYPALYLLHGVGGAAGVGPEEWLGYALTETLERMLSLRLLEPMIVVLPQGEQSYWMNRIDGGPRWADFVAEDLVANVDATFRTVPVREARAVGGLSMGGHGALQLAYNFPDTFSIAGAHSPSLRELDQMPAFAGGEESFARVDPRSLVEGGAPAGRVTTWIDVGHDDLWRWRAQEVRDALLAVGAPVSYHVLEGEHEGWYWLTYLPQYLRFYSGALHAVGRTPGGAPLVEAELLPRNAFAPVAWAGASDH
jgi:enterochelin esterase-like enzyme